MPIRLTASEGRSLEKSAGLRKPFSIGKALSKFSVDQSESGKANRTYDGRTYDSIAEMREAAELDVKKRAGMIRSWIPQYRVPLVVNGVKICAMVIDFKVFHNDGTVEYREVKGCETVAYKLKRKLFAALEPDATYTVVKAR